MSIYELNREQMEYIKANWLDSYLMEHENRNISWGEMAEADSIVPDDTMFEEYSGTDFVEEDFPF